MGRDGTTKVGVVEKEVGQWKGVRGMTGGWTVRHMSVEGMDETGERTMTEEG